MSELSSKTVLVIDNGLFISLAQRLAKDFGRVLYHCPCERGFSKFEEAIMGYGFEGIEWCTKPFDVRREIDLMCHFDVERSDLQLAFEEQGIPVWGSRNGDSLELNRQKFHRLLGEFGLDVPLHRVVKGLSELRAFLKDNPDNTYFIKTSRYRGSFETAKFRNWRLDESLVDDWAFRFGPAKELIPFIVCDAIETNLEIGADTWNIDGKWPELCLRADECKDKAFVSAVVDRKELAPQIEEVLKAFGPELERHRYRNFWSMEIRIAEDKAYFGDATTRGPMPGSSSHMEIWRNFSEIIWAGAHGELISPEAVTKHSCELALNVKNEENAWASTEWPKELHQWIKPTYACVIDNKLCWPPNPPCFGWLVAVDDSVEGVISKIKDYADMLPDGMSVDMEPLGELIEVVQEGKDSGIDFPAEIPEPEIVLQ